MKFNRVHSLRVVLASVFRRVSWSTTAFVWAVCCISCVLAGPFGTYDAMDAGARAAYWTILISLGVVFGLVTYAICLWGLGKEKTPLFPLLAALLMTLIYAPVIISLRTAFAMRIEALEVFPVSMAVNTFFITFAVFAFRQFLPQGEGDTLLSTAHGMNEPDEEVAAPEPEPRLWRRLPEEIRGRILYISANDHHVEVVTQAGRHVLRLRLADAINEMEPVEGMCVHRSHWVALAAIAQVERINAHKTQVHLINGDTLPVSRKYKINLDEAGLTETSIAAS